MNNVELFPNAIIECGRKCPWGLILVWHDENAKAECRKLI
jgi:hypothetical protein